MPESDQLVDGNDQEASASASKQTTARTRKFSRRHCFTGVFLLCLVVQNLVSSPVNSVDLQLSSLLLYASSSSPTDSSKDNKTDDGLFEILCTTVRTGMLTGGSYIIRCRDFKTIAEHCAKNVRVHLYGHHELIFKPNSTINPDSWKKDFNATITVKNALTPKPRFGKLFMDVVDRYTFFGDLDPQVQVIVQTKYHAWDVFPNHTYHVVEHWYNSFPEDMLASRDIPDFKLPAITMEVGDTSNNTIKMATVWTNRKQPCPTISSDVHNNSDVIYDCISEKFVISRWYHKYLNSTDAMEMQRLENLLQDPNQGPGRIYYELFWKYDVLVVPAKTALPEKLRWGNVQRAVSQMRSGVPVLLEIIGEVLEDFMTTYNYTCAYKTNGDNGDDGAIGNKKTPKKRHKKPGGIQNTSLSRKYWTLEEAVMAMKKSPELRKKCQQEGLDIAKDYSPAGLVEVELRILGFHGDFDCPR